MQNKKNSSLGALILAIGFILLPMGYLYPIDNTEPPAQPVLPMIRAMGGAFTAVANDENAVFYNPAGYAIINNGIISVFSLGIKVNIDDSALRLYNALISGTNVGSSENINTYFSDTTVAAGITGPIYFGRVGNNFGFSFFDSINISMDTRPGGMQPSAVFNAYTDLGFIGGYSVELPFLKNLYTGLNLKVVLRTKSNIEGTVLGVIDTISNSSEIPLSKAIGFGGDFGILYIPYSWFSLGLSAKDFFGTRFSSWEPLNQSEPFPRSSIKPRIAFGMAFYPLRGTTLESKNFNNFVVAIDYSDLLDYSSILSNINFGMSFNTLRIINLRGGFEGGYPALGFGFDLNFFHLDIVYFVDELGAYPGANPVQNLMFNFAFKW